MTNKINEKKYSHNNCIRLILFYYISVIQIAITIIKIITDNAGENAMKLISEMSHLSLMPLLYIIF